MLKIKDGIDLKELEFFGFELFITNSNEYYRKRLDTLTNSAFIIVKPITRMVIIDSKNTYIEEIDILYDLIKADMVEKG